MFVECPVARAIWERVAIWVQTPSLLPANWEQAKDVKEWFLQLVNRIPPPIKEGIRSLIMLTLWEIWRERNGRVFRKEGRRMPKIMEAIFDEAGIWAYA